MGSCSTSTLTPPDLFWAIRGGGGNFGVVTRFRYQLHPAESFVGGVLVLPATAATIAGFMAAATQAPDELSAIANVMGCPPMPFVPAECHGEVVLLAMIGHTGDLTAGERAMEPFRALAAPIADLLKPMAYAEMFAMDEREDYASPQVVGGTLFLDKVDEAAGQVIVDALGSSDAAMKAVQLRALGGAMSRVAPDVTAFAHRHAGVMATVTSSHDGSPDDRAARQAWANRLIEQVDDGTPGAYVNFIGDEGEERIRQAYPGATWQRLVEVKSRYDPGNVFRRNQNIPPRS